MKTTTHSDFNKFLADLTTRHQAGHKTWCKDSPKGRYLGFLDFDEQEWVRVGLAAVKVWEPTEDQGAFKDALKTVDGRHELMGKPIMREEVFEGHTFQIADEPAWVDTW